MNQVKFSDGKVFVVVKVSQKPYFKNRSLRTVKNVTRAMARDGFRRSGLNAS